ncbi:hypothetical protein ACC740_37580, partial [Rhizobium ruizarguesonis]
RRPGPPSPELTLRKYWCLTLGISVNVGSIGLCLMGFGEPFEKMEIQQAGSSLSAEMQRIEATARPTPRTSRRLAPRRARSSSTAA